MTLVDIVKEKAPPTYIFFITDSPPAAIKDPVNVFDAAVVLEDTILPTYSDLPMPMPPLYIKEPVDALELCVVDEITISPAPVRENTKVLFRRI